MAPADEANSIRAEGNALYNSRDFQRAVEKYKQAAELVPTDATPLGNLSAAQYELGEYEECAETAKKALLILDGDESAVPAAVEKLKQRIAKANAQHVLSGKNEQFKRRLRVLEAILRYRPTMSLDVEYYLIGHNTSTSIFDDAIVKDGASEGPVSMLFGGIGDARNMLRTIIDVTQYDRRPGSKKKQYHFTIIDINNVPSPET